MQVDAQIAMERTISSLVTWSVEISKPDYSIYFCKLTMALNFLMCINFVLFDLVMGIC